MRQKLTLRDVRPRNLRRQRDVLCDVMLAAGQCETWLALHELARLTGYGEASVSAQLRHLRKPQFGGFLVEKRPRGASQIARGERGTLWEYQLRRQVRSEARRPVREGRAKKSRRHSRVLATTNS